MRQLGLQPRRQASGGFSTSHAEQQMRAASPVPPHLATEVCVLLVAVWTTKPNMSKPKTISLRTKLRASIFAMIFLLCEGRLM
jgi:hypothetical protein